jgi:hypothetical protein
VISNTDMVRLKIPDEIKNYCKDASEHLMKERTFETLDGGGDFVYRGCLVQEMYHLWLKERKWPHEYMRPYTPTGRPKDEWDIKIAGETFDTKCRGFWNEKYPIEHLFSQREYEQRERLKSDYYLLGVTDKDRDIAYLLGGLSYERLWDSMKEPKQFWDNARTKPREYKFETYGYILSKDLDPLKKIIFRI